MTNYARQLDNLVAQYKALDSTDAECPSDIGTRLEALRFSYAKIVAIYKPVTTIPALFHRSYDENFISDYIAHILHPVHSGLGYSALQSILDFLSIPIDLNSVDLVGLQIRREFTLSEEDRIDILILHKKAKLLIAIENKIFSYEGFHQTNRYSEAIQKYFPDYTQVLIYLTPSGKNPSSSDFKSLSYADLSSAFARIRITDISERDRFIFQDFILHVENYIMKSVNLKLSEKSILYLKNAEMITDLTEAFSEDSSNIFQAFAEIIKTVFEGVSEGWEYTFSEDRPVQQVWKKHWYENQIWVHFEYWLSKESLFTESEFSFMVDVEGKQKDKFLEKFDNLHSSLKSEYHKHGIQYRPNSRKIAIAFKEYDFQLFPENVNRELLVSSFQKTIDDFVFLIEPIEQTISKLKSI